MQAATKSRRPTAVLVTSSDTATPPPPPPPSVPLPPTPPPPQQQRASVQEASLPKNWKRTKKKGSIYYYNAVTCQTSMDMNNLPPPLAPNWQEAVDQKTGTTYYWNKKTRETRPSPPIQEETV